MIIINNEFYLKAGIYKITCVENSKFYIGSSVNITERWRQHLSHLRSNNHHSLYLQRCYNKYGEGSIKFEVLALLNEYNETILRTLEFIYIEQLHPHFNATSPEIKNYSLEWREKISETTKKLYESGYKNPRLDCGKKYKVFSFNGKLMMSNISIKKVADFVGAKDYHFFNTCLKKNNYVTNWKRGEFIIMEMSKTKQDLLEYYKSLKTKNIAICSTTHLYSGRLSNEQKRLKNCVKNSSNFIYKENGVIYTFPCLQPDAEI